MSGYSGGTPCPNCQRTANLSSDSKPFDHTSIQCPHCGFQVSPVITYMTLEELNELRAAEDMNPLDKLPEQDPDIW